METTHRAGPSRKRMHGNTDILENEGQISDLGDYALQGAHSMESKSVGRLKRKGVKVI